MAENTALKKPVEHIYLIESLRLANLNQYAGQAAQPLISGGRIYPVEILYPPIPLQQRFAFAVQMVQQANERMTDSLQTSDALFASLQQQAFSGQL